MSLLHPFQALRPAPERAAEIAAVPYDVVNVAEAKKIVQGNPLSFLHVSRPEVDFPDGTDSHSNEVYQRAAFNFQELIRMGPLLKEAQPTLYLYRLRVGHHEQTGIVGCFSVDEYDACQIKKHEKTRKDKEDDRTRHLTELSSQTGPVFLTYRDVAEVDQEVERIKASRPLYDFVAPDQVSHTAWIVPEPKVLVDYFARRVSALYIADGHHRAAAAGRVRAERASRNPHHGGNEEYNFFLAVAFPLTQLRVLPYHRVVKDLRGMTADALLEKVSSTFEILPGEAVLPKLHEFGMYLGRKWYCLRPRSQPDQVQPLDVTLLQERLLGPVFGISDPRTDSRIDFVGGGRGLSELERLVDSGYAAVAFSMHPTPLQSVVDIADEGGIMPPKSTWFEPKLRDGLFCHKIE